MLNLVDFYHDEVGLEALKAKVTRPFAGLEVAAYYGCLLTRPPKVTLAEDPEYPTHMDEVLEALGCEPVEWTFKTDCCGASLALCEQAVVVELVRKIVANARACGAQAIACACPLCQVNLDTRQGDIKKADPELGRRADRLSEPVRRPRHRRARRRARPQEAHGASRRGACLEHGRTPHTTKAQKGAALTRRPFLRACGRAQPRARSAHRRAPRRPRVCSFQ